MTELEWSKMSVKTEMKTFLFVHMPKMLILIYNYIIFKLELKL